MAREAPDCYTDVPKGGQVTSGRIRRSEASALTRSPGKPKSTHGGKRPGAGPPTLVDQPVRRTVYLDQWHIQFVEAYAEAQGFPTFSAALRELLEERAKM
jgi:hypothetical protein